MNRVRVPPAVVSAWSAVSPFGIGASAMADGLRDRTDAATVLDRDRWPVPGERRAHGRWTGCPRWPC